MKLTEDQQRQLDENHGNSIMQFMLNKQFVSDSHPMQLDSNLTREIIARMDDLKTISTDEKTKSQTFAFRAQDLIVALSKFIVEYNEEQNNTITAGQYQSIITIVRHVGFS